MNNWRNPKFEVGEIVSFNDNSLASKKDYVYLGYLIQQPIVMCLKTKIISATTDDRLISRGYKYSGSEGYKG